jgi:aminotransferase in exopolysaccharide biosynthesis
MRQGISVDAATTTVADAIFVALRQVVPVARGPVALHEPVFRGREWDYVRDCIDTGWVSSAGAYVDRFEAMLAEVTGAAYAVATVNGTAALHVALQLAGVQAGDEVLIPAQSFVATANAVTYCGATPHFVDSEERTLGLDPVALRDYLASMAEIRNGTCWNRHTQRPIRALVPMHTFGHPVNLDGVLAVAQDFRLELVEDAAESLGSFYRGRHTGTFGRLGILSFNGNKTVTSGGGGAILTNDVGLARRAKHLTTTAKIPHRWEYAHDEIGYNYRLPNLNAALGCAQLEQLPSFLESKRRLHAHYQQAFAALPQVKLVTEPEGCRSNYWLQTLLLDDAIAGARDVVLAKTNEAGLMTRPAWALLHRLSMYQRCPRAPLPVAEDLGRRLINLPSSVGLA